MSESPDLSFVDTDELIAEVKRRHDAALFVLHRNATTTDDETFTVYHGGLSVCIGLAERAKHRLLQIALNSDVVE